MRNLKRVLSLALAAMMLIGMMVITSSAAEATKTSFPDADEITNTEAVDVITAIGVMQGHDDGTFAPSDILTREQAATIICNMLLGKENAEKLAATADVFTDVPASWWSAKYVAYCVNLGIISGNGDGTFDPEGQLTGTAFGKMMLVALGYNAQYQNYLGNPNWESLVISDMLEAGIAVDGINATEPLNRDNAAQMAFQTLTADMVKYANKGSQIITSDGTQVIQTPSAAEPVTSNNNVAYDGISDNVQQFCEKYFPDLTKGNAEGEDEFGRPGSYWQYDGRNICFGADKVAATFTNTFTTKDLYNVLGRNTAKELTSGNLEVIVDGGAAQTVIPTSGSDYNPTGEALYNDRTKSTKLGDNGMLTEVYVDDGDVTIVMINTYLAQVSGDYNSSRETLAIDVKSDSVGSKTLSLDEFSYLDTFQDKDWVLVTIAGDEVQSIVLADTITGSVDSVTGSTKVTVDGVAYNYSALKTGTVATTNIGDEIVLILDAYGYVIGTDNVKGGVDSYVFLNQFDRTGNSFNAAYQAEAFFADGAKEVITINKVNDQKPTGADTAHNAWISTNKNDPTVATHYAGWYTYSQNNDGSYDVNAVTGSNIATGSNSAGTQTPSTVGTGTTVTTHGSTTIKYGSSANNTVSGNNSTVFLIKDGDKATAYTGVRNVPTVKASNSTDNTKVWVVVKSNNYASYVFIDAGSAQLTETGDDTSDQIFILDTAATVSGSGNNKIYTYEAILNGDYGDDVTVDSTKTLSRGLLTNVQYNNKGQINSGSVLNTNSESRKVLVVDGKNVTYSDGVLKVGTTSFLLSDDCDILLIENDTDVRSISGSSLAGLYKDDALTGIIYAVLKNKEVTNLYVDVTDIDELPPVETGDSETAKDAIDNGLSVTITGNDGGAVNLGDITLVEGQTVTVSNNAEAAAQTISGTVDVASGGTLSVDTSGDNSATKTLTISNGTTTIKEGGTLSVGDGEKVVVEKGASLVIDDAASISGTETITIEVKEEATLEIGGTLVTEGTAAVTITGGGAVVVPTDTTLTVGAAAAPTNRAARDASGVTLTIDTNTALTVEGTGKIVVTSGNSLVVNGTLTYEEPQTSLPAISGTGTVELGAATAILDARYQSGYDKAGITLEGSAGKYDLKGTAADMAKLVSDYNTGDNANDTGSAALGSTSESTNWLSQLRGMDNNNWINAGVTVKAPMLDTTEMNSVTVERTVGEGEPVKIYNNVAAAAGAHFDENHLLHLYFGMGQLLPSTGEAANQALKASEIKSVKAATDADVVFNISWQVTGGVTVTQDLNVIRAVTGTSADVSNYKEPQQEAQQTNTDNGASETAENAED